MLSSVLTKSIYEKRWMMLGWALGIASLIVLTVLLYPTFSKGVADAFKNVPDSLKSLIGDASAYSTIKGYVNLQVIQQMPFMVIIMSVILFSGMIAGEENDGTLQSLLVQPVSRTRVFIQKFIAGGVIVASGALAVFLSAWLSVVIIKESLPLAGLLEACFAMWLISMIFGVLAYSMGAITSKRGLSGALSGGLAFAAYMITGLANGVPALRGVEKASPFHYYNSPAILEHGLHWSHVGILVAVMAVMFIISLIVFNKRDVYQQ